MAAYDNLLANVPTDLWIGGKWKKSSDGARFDVIDPATEQKIASVASASIDDAKAALDAAQGAFPAWAAKKPRERGEILRKAYELIIRDAERLAKLITIENGKALSDSRGEVAYAAEFFRWYAEEGVRNLGTNGTAPSSGARIFVHHKPIGVGVLVTPWNFPAAMATRKIGPALAAGCPVVLKPASETPLTMLALMPILEEAGVPAGGVNVIPSARSRPVADATLHPPGGPFRPGGRCQAARPARPGGVVHRFDRGRPQAPAQRRRSGAQHGDGAGRQRAVHRVRGRRHRRRDRRRDDRQDAQHGRGLHGGEPFLRPREGAGRVFQKAHRQDGGAEDGQRSGRRRGAGPAGQRRRPRQGGRARRRRARQGRQDPHRRQGAGRHRILLSRHGAVERARQRQDAERGDLRAGRVAADLQGRGRGDQARQRHRIRARGLSLHQGPWPRAARLGKTRLRNDR